MHVYELGALGQTDLPRTDPTETQGRTLYLFLGDKPNVSTLSAAGRTGWPPFTAKAKPTSLNHVVGSQVGTIKEASGSFRITYFGHPLYDFHWERHTPQRRPAGSGALTRLERVRPALARPRSLRQSRHASSERIGSRIAQRVRLELRLLAA